MLELPRKGKRVTTAGCLILLTSVAQAQVDPTSLAVVASNTKNTLYWGNDPSNNGTLILRATGGTPNTPPTDGVQYSVGAVLGNATVVYSAPTAGTSQSAADTGLTNYTSYTYVGYGYAPGFLYSPGTSGITSIPTTQAAPDPAWCYSTGSPSLANPMVLPNVAIFASTPNGMTANNTVVSNPSADGQERFRPVTLSGNLTNYFFAAQLSNGSGNTYAFLGTDDGTAHAVNANNGSVVWNSLAIGTSIQAPVSGQFSSYSNAAYKAVYGNTDLIIAATRNGNPTNNQACAFNGANGNLIGCYRPGNLDDVNGAVQVDYAGNQALIVSRAGTRGTQQSFRFVSTLNASLLAGFSLGDVDQLASYGTTYAYVVSNYGVMYAFNLSTHAQAWAVCLDGSTPTGSPKRCTSAFVPNYPVWPAERAFYVTSLSSRTWHIQKWTDNGGSPPTKQWDITTINGVTGGSYNWVSHKFYVGSNDGYLREINLDGTWTKSRNLFPSGGSSRVVGTPTSDHIASRVQVGTLDGRICSYSIPF